MLRDEDAALVAAAKQVIADRYRPGRHVVGAALRTRSGRLFTGVDIETTIGRLAVCAEAIALGRAATEAGDTDVETIVAVYHSESGSMDTEACIVSPCGMCREMIADYAPEALVIMPGPGDQPELRSISELLPDKFVRPG